MSGYGNCPTCHAPLEEHDGADEYTGLLVCRERCGYTRPFPKARSHGEVSAKSTQKPASDPPNMPIATPGLSGVDEETAMDFWANNCHNWGDPGCEQRFQMCKRQHAVRGRRLAV